MPTLTFKLPFIDVGMTPEEVRSLKSRFTRNPLYKGPCMIVNRANGLALDSGYEGKIGGHTCLWQAHAAPWQQWRIKPAGNGAVTISSEATGFNLTSMAQGADWGEVWLDRKLHNDWSDRWKLTPTDDQVAFRIETAGSHFSIDTGDSGKNGLDPWLWSSHWEPWQQWIIVRLPLT